MRGHTAGTAPGRCGEPEFVRPGAKGLRGGLTAAAGPRRERSGGAELCDRAEGTAWGRAAGRAGGWGANLHHRRGTGCHTGHGSQLRHV